MSFDASGDESPTTFKKTEQGFDSESSTNFGSITLHGPHQVVAKSITTSLSPASAMAASNYNNKRRLGVGEALLYLNVVTLAKPRGHVNSFFVNTPKSFAE